MNEKDEKDLKLPASLDLSKAIEGILAHPELISMVASTLGKPPQSVESPMDAAPAADAEASPLAAIAESAPTPSAEAISALAPLLSGLSGLKKGGSPSKSDDPRICLLLALKPYLSASRCEAIDTMIRLSTISEVLRGLPGGADKGKGG